MSGLVVGGAEKKLELPLGLDLSGYIARKNPGAEGINDELSVKCIVIKSGNEIMAFVSCELLGLSSTFVKETKKMIIQKVVIPEDNIIIHCIHTHSGPASIFIQGCGEVNEEWQEGLKTTIADCIAEASQKLVPSYVTYKTGTCNIGYNRIGHSLLHGIEKREGNTDDQVGILTFYRKKDDAVMSVIVNYACHPVVLTYTNMLYSADYPHYMEEALKRHMSGNINVLYATGCCGDIDPKKRGSFELAKEVGEELAASITGINEEKYSTSSISGITFSVKTYSIRIPVMHKLHGKDATDILEEYKNGLNNELETESDYFKVKVCHAYIKWAERMLEKIRTGTLEDYIEADIKVVRIGDIVMVTHPFEAFHDIGLKIKKYFGMDNTMVVGYTNGDFGYLASKEQYHESRYEVKEAFRYYGCPGPFSEDSEDIILNAIL